MALAAGIGDARAAALAGRAGALGHHLAQQGAAHLPHAAEAAALGAGLGPAAGGGRPGTPTIAARGPDNRPLEVTFEKLSDEIMLPQFKPAGK